MMVTRMLDKFVRRRVSNAPLVIFRVLFGAMMVVSIVRFILNGWIDAFYVRPQLHFPFYGMEWIRPMPQLWMHALFGLMLLTALGIMLGLFYRTCCTLFFLAFTYVELIDKTFYLNHYYFISLLGFLLIWLPANRRMALDSWRNPGASAKQTSVLNINILRLQVGIVYLFAGLSKVNRAWLLDAMPLRIWLPANGHLPLLGNLLKQSWVAYAFSWFGALYDLTIPFWFLIPRLRWIAYATVVIFHILTWVLFPIGVFPIVMIVSGLLFFPCETQESWLSTVESKFFSRSGPRNESPIRRGVGAPKALFFAFYLVVQVLIPLRYLLYPGNIYWNEEGFRFSWRVMLMEKAGYVAFKVTDPNTRRRYVVVNNLDYLTPYQERMMSTQPDMILQFAHYLKKEYQKKGIVDPIVTADSFVSLNGASSRRFIKPDVNLSNELVDLAHRNWLIEYEDL